MTRLQPQEAQLLRPIVFVTALLAAMPALARTPQEQALYDLYVAPRVCEDRAKLAGGMAANRDRGQTIEQALVGIRGWRQRDPETWNIMMAMANDIWGEARPTVQRAYRHAWESCGWEAMRRSR